ncbi:MAG: hypothetical protein IPP04_06950 [Saprospiraceae bacterium]|nr:hypothetical protein [Saprospiraceae bacterium]
MPEYDHKSLGNHGLKAMFNDASAVSIAEENALAMETQHENQQKQIEAAAVLGINTGFIPRSDKFGFNELQDAKPNSEQEKKKREWDSLRFAILALSRSIEAGLNALGQSIDKGYKLAEQILKDINDTNLEVESMESSHDEFTKALKDGEPLKDDHGNFKSKAIQELAERASKRFGKPIPDDPAKLIIFLKMQMEHEKHKVIPTMKTVNGERADFVYNKLLPGTDANNRLYKELIDRMNRLLRQPDSPEKQKEMEEIDVQVNKTRDAERNYVTEGQTNGEGWKQGIEKVSNETDFAPETSNKIDDLEGSDDLSFNPAKSDKPNSPITKPGL